MAGLGIRRDNPTILSYVIWFRGVRVVRGVGEVKKTGGREGEANAFGGREGLGIREVCGGGLGASEGGVRRRVVVCSARRSARVVPVWSARSLSR